MARTHRKKGGLYSAFAQTGSYINKLILRAENPRINQWLFAALIGGKNRPRPFFGAWSGYAGYGLEVGMWKRKRRFYLVGGVLG